MLEKEAIMAFYGTWRHGKQAVFRLSTIEARIAAALGCLGRPGLAWAGSATDFGRDLKVGRE